MLDLKPVLKDGYVLDGWYKLGTRGQESVTGELWLQLTYHAIRVRALPHYISQSARPLRACELLGTVTSRSVRITRSRGRN